MEITYLAHSAFKIKGKDVTIVTDPYDPKIGHKKLSEKCDVVTLSHDHYDHAYVDGVSEYHLLVNSAGEYETKGVFIYGYPTFHDATQGTERGKNTIYQIDIDGFTVLHLGDLGHELSKDTLEKLSDVDVLLIPVGGVYTIDSKVATKVISSIEPGYVVPMHYQTDELTLGEKLDPLKKFLDEMGVEKPKNGDTLKISRKSDVPEETDVVVLKPTK